MKIIFSNNMSITGTLQYSFTYTGNLNPAPNFATEYLPIKNNNSSFTTLNVSFTDTANLIEVSIAFVFTDNSSATDGLSFQSVFNFYQQKTTGLTITQFNNIPLSRAGSQFPQLSNYLSFTANDAPTILANTSLQGCFLGSNFNSPLTLWSTSNVTNMDSMFAYASSFNQSLSTFNTANVTNMGGMFSGASAFNQSLSTFNTANVTNMSGMFFGASIFNQPLSTFNTANVTDMNFMFVDASAFNQNLTSWNIAKVTTHDNFSAGSALTAGNLPYFDGPPAPPQPIACFKAGTKILCIVNEKETYIPIDQLRKGAIVKTSKSGNKQIVLIGKKTMTNPSHSLFSKDRLYKCTSAKYPELIEDLIITGSHAILVNPITNDQRSKIPSVLGDIYVTEELYRLPVCLDDRSSIYEESGDFVIYHLALANESYYNNYGVYANGLLVESCSQRYLKELSNMDLIE